MIEGYWDWPLWRCECYEHTWSDGRQIVWNVTKAKWLMTQTRRRLACIDRKAMERMMQQASQTCAREQGRPYEESMPGIAVAVLEDEQGAMVLIDGHHRLAKAYEEGKVFTAHMLTNAESILCIVRCDDWSLIP